MGRDDTSIVANASNEVTQRIACAALHHLTRFMNYCD